MKNDWIIGFIGGLITSLLIACMFAIAWVAGKMWVVWDACSKTGGI